jgi:hypothetical protein
VRDGAVEAVRGVRAARTPRIRPAVDRRAEHEVEDEQLRATVEELGQCLRPVVGLEAVVLLDGDPRQRLPLQGKLVAGRVSSFSSARSAIRAASHSSRVPFVCSVISSAPFRSSLLRQPDERKLIAA